MNLSTQFPSSFQFEAPNSGMLIALQVLYFLLLAALTLFAMVVVWRLMRAHEHLAEQHQELVKTLARSNAPK